VASGSSLILDGSSTININLPTGNTASVNGAMTAQGSAHKFTAVDASAIKFHTGATFTTATGFSSNAFGTANLNSIIFESGSSYIHGIGSNPFGATAPNTVVVFQTGSLFKYTSTAAPSFSGRVYPNLEIDAVGFSQSGTGGAFSVDNLTITNGTLNLNLTGGISIKGNISVAPGQTLTFTPASANTITFNGTTPQTLSNSGTLTFGPNASVAINNANGVTLNTDVAVGATLTFTNGSIDLGNHNLTASAVSGGSSSSYAKTTGTGSLIIKNLTALTTFPVGNGTSYTPATIANAGTADDFGVNVITGTPCSADPFQSVNRVWNITEAIAGGSNADITLQWNTTDENLTFIRLACAAVHCSGAVIDKEGPTGAATPNGAAYTQTITGVTSFSPFGATSDQVALPLGITYFRGAKQGSTNILNWKVNCASSPRATMTVERSADGRNFLPIHTITATAVECLSEFGYTDAAPLPGLNYYRLRSVDADGKAVYSTILTLLNKEKGLEIVDITPNPNKGQFRLNVTTTERSPMDIVIVDMQGRVVSKTTTTLISGYNAVNINVSQLSSGMYQVYGITADGQTKPVNFIKQ
jgi:hypothetical protein